MDRATLLGGLKGRQFMLWNWLHSLTELDLTLYMVSVYNFPFFLDFPVLVSHDFFNFLIFCWYFSPFITDCVTLDTIAVTLN